MNKINLIDGDIQHSNLFLHMPIFDEIYFEGMADGKVRKYKAVREGQDCRMHVLSFIRKDEDVLWDSLQDMFKHVSIQSAQKARGIYTFDLLTFDIHKEVKSFDLQQLVTVIVNNSQRMTPGSQRLVKYSTIYGLLQKMVHEDWGKMVLKTSVEVFKDKPEFLDLMVKQLVKNFEFSYEPAILLLNDLSQSPVFDAQNTLQQERLAKLMKAQFSTTIEFPPEVYIQDKNGVRELLSGLEIK